MSQLQDQTALLVGSNKSYYSSLSEAHQDCLRKFCVVFGVPRYMGQDMPLGVEPATYGTFTQTQIEHQNAQRQYRLSNIITIGLLVLQIIIALLITTLSAYGGFQIPVTVLGGVNVAFAAGLALLKGMQWTDKKWAELKSCQDTINSIEKGMRDIVSSSLDHLPGTYTHAREEVESSLGNRSKGNRSNGKQEITPRSFVARPVASVERSAGATQH